MEPKEQSESHVEMSQRLALLVELAVAVFGSQVEADFDPFLALVVLVFILLKRCCESGERDWVALEFQYCASFSGG